MVGGPVTKSDRRWSNRSWTKLSYIVEIWV